MPPEFSRSEWLEAHRILREDIQGVNNRLDTLNSRTRKNEVSSAVQWVLWIIVGASALALLPLLVSHIK